MKKLQVNLVYMKRLLVALRTHFSLEQTIDEGWTLENEDNMNLLQSTIS